MQEEILVQLRDVITRHLQIQVPDLLVETARIYEDLRIDSIAILQLLVYIEDAFDVSIPEEEIDPKAFTTIGSLVLFIQSLLKSKE